MTPAANPPDPSRPGRFVAGLGLAASLLAAVALALSGGGCSKPPTVVKDDQESTGPKGDPWKAAGTRLKKDTDLLATKTALSALTSDVSSQEGQKLPPLTDEGFATLSALVTLSPGDREEIRGSAFSPHDPAYLADCFYLRDAARSLALAGLPPEWQADLAFAWVCRQVYVHPWVRQLDAQTFRTTTLPPTAVLRRGFGSGLERMYVFLALLQQLELDGCLVGRPAVASTTTEFVVNVPVDTPAGLAAAAQAAPRGSFWAAGVRVGGDVRLYDPWRGAVLPVTLNQLRANPDAAKAWFEDKANASGATLEDAKKATVFLAVPVNALSPRMAAFEARLKGELGVKVAYDAKALEARRAAFPDPKPAYWNPPEDPFAYGRAARSYLPLDMGGADPTPQSPGRLYEASLREQIPATAFTSDKALGETLAQLGPAARQRLGTSAAIPLAVSFVEPPNPRERIQRGQFQDAAKDIVSKQEHFASGLERLRVNKDADEQIKEWVKVANALYGDLGGARLNNNKEAEAAAAAQIELHWRQAGAQLLIDRASAEVGRAEALFLLAVCKHELAERLQARLERAGPEASRLKTEALDAWQTALAAWRTYEQLSSAHAGFPGRAAHGRTLSARAAACAGADAKK